MSEGKPYRNRRLRKLMFDLTGGFCAKCGRFDQKGECDHVVPLWQRGADSIENIQWLCRACHLRKSVGEAPIRAKADRLASRHATMKRRRQIPARAE